MMNGTMVVPSRKAKPTLAAEVNFNDWLDMIPKMESHYCRKNSSRLYVGEEFKSLAKMYAEYKRYSINADLKYLKITTFTSLCCLAHQKNTCWKRWFSFAYQEQS